MSKYLKRMKSGTNAQGEPEPHEWDPNHDIESKCGEFTAKQWVDELAYKNCHHCDLLLKKSQKHHCRLCGHMFCSLCTLKKHLPEKFKVKGKEGAARCCISCVDKALGKVHKADDQGVIRIHPPRWDQMAVDCRKCSIACEGKKHNCRGCGHVFCGNCTSKMDVPPAFRRKGKKGLVRVCDLCRYVVVAGAILDESPAAVDPDDESMIGPRAGDVSATATPRASVTSAASSAAMALPGPPGCDSSSEDGDDEAAEELAKARARRQVAAAAKKQDAATEKAARKADKAAAKAAALEATGPAPPPVLTIKWEAKNKTYKLELTQELATLERVDQALRSSNESLKFEKFEYVLDGAAIHKMHWDVYKTYYLLPELTIQAPVDKRKVKRVAQSPKNPSSTKAKVKARSKYNYENQKEGSYLSLTKGENLTITDQKSEQWWWALTEAGEKGWVPAKYMEVVEILDETPSAEAQGKSLPEIPQLQDEEAVNERLREARKRAKEAGTKTGASGGFRRAAGAKPVVVEKKTSAPVKQKTAAAVSTPSNDPFATRRNLFN